MTDNWNTKDWSQSLRLSEKDGNLNRNSIFCRYWYYFSFFPFLEGVVQPRPLKIKIQYPGSFQILSSFQKCIISLIFFFIKWQQKHI